MLCKNRDFWGTSPRISNRGKRPPTPVATPIAMGVVYDAFLILSFHNSENNSGAPVTKSFTHIPDWLIVILSGRVRSTGQVN